MNKIPNRQAICDVLMEKAKEDKDIVVITMSTFATRIFSTYLVEIQISSHFKNCGIKQMYNTLSY